MKRRLFLAIQLPEDMQQDLGKYKKMVNVQGASWVTATNLHVTVYFLGGVDEKVVEDLGAAVRTALVGTAAFTLVPRQVIFAPPHNPIRMVWLQFNGSQAFADLTAKCYKAVAPFIDGQPPYDEDHVVPHVTMARLLRPPSLGVLLPQVGLSEVPVASVDLVASDLQTGGAQYMVLEKFAFAQ
jgi:RNA 2',3'-cyclic 3'-phosphodiesterase